MATNDPHALLPEQLMFAPRLAAYAGLPNKELVLRGTLVAMPSHFTHPDHFLVGGKMVCEELREYLRKFGNVEVELIVRPVA